MEGVVGKLEDKVDSKQLDVNVAEGKGASEKIEGLKLQDVEEVVKQPGEKDVQRVAKENEATKTEAAATHQDAKEGKELEDKENVARKHDLKVSQNGEGKESESKFSLTAGGEDGSSSGVSDKQDFPPFDVESPEDVDTYLTKFEKHARSRGWARETWAEKLAEIVLRRDALEYYKSEEYRSKSEEEKEKEYGRLRLDLVRESIEAETSRKKVTPEMGDGFPAFMSMMSGKLVDWSNQCQKLKDTDALTSYIHGEISKLLEKKDDSKDDNDDNENSPQASA